MGQSSEELRQILEKMKQELLPEASSYGAAFKVEKAGWGQRVTASWGPVKWKLILSYSLLAVVIGLLVSLTLKNLFQAKPALVADAASPPVAAVAVKKPLQKAAPPKKNSAPAIVLNAGAIQAPPAAKAAIKPSAESPVITDAQELFFKRPSDYAGRELEMDLQIITARRQQRGWKLNFAYTSPGKGMTWLNVEDASVLGANPELRIGYFYKVRFRCERGETASGNILSSITPTGQKAVWATEISAIE